MRKIFVLFLTYVLVFTQLPLCFGEGAESTEEVCAAAAEVGYVEGEVIASFEAGAALEDVCAQLEACGAVDVQASIESGALSQEALDEGGAICLELAAGACVEEAEAALDECAAVEASQPNYIYTLCDLEDSAVWQSPIVNTPGQSSGSAGTGNSSSGSSTATTYSGTLNDPIAQTTTAPSSSTSTAKTAWQLECVNALEAWNTVTCSGSVTVAVLDTGCLMTHEDLSANVLSSYAYDVVSGRTLTGDISGHGTHVAGVVAATANNSLGTAGCSYNAQVLPVNIFYTYQGQVMADTSTLIAGYKYVLNLAKRNSGLNIRVINLSLGSETTEEDEALTKLIDQAFEAGIVTVCAAGNSASTSYCFPADYGACVSVTALSVDGSSPASWSNYNVYKDLCAPGECITSTYATSKTTYANMSGTSQACPVVSAAFALLFAYDSSLTVAQAKAILYSSADADGLEVSSKKAGLYGAGVVDYAAALELAGSIEAEALDALVEELGTNVTETVPSPSTEATALAKGSYVIAGKGATKAVYKVVGNKKLMYVRCAKGSKSLSNLKSVKSVTTVRVASTVKIEGVTYKVVRVKAKAFKNMTSLKRLTIGKNVRKIGAQAFKGCTSLTKITLKTKLLRRAGVRNCLKNSSVLVVRVPASKLAYYTVILSKLNSGKEVTVK